MKKLLSILLAALMLFGCVISVFAEEKPVEYEGFKLEVSDLKVVVGGKDSGLQGLVVKFFDGEGEKRSEKKYIVYKLRDLAATLKDSEAKFNIGYDNVKKSVTVENGADYTVAADDLKTVSIENAVVKKSSDKLIVNGKEVEIPGYNINGHNYYRLSQIQKAFNTFRFRSAFNNDPISYIEFDKSDIKPFEKEAFLKELAKADYTIVETWGPWCYYSKRSLPIMTELLKSFKDEKKNIQIVGLVNDYANYSEKDLNELFGGAERPWVNFAQNDEAKAFMKEKLGDDVKFFPHRVVFDKNGNLIGKEYFTYYDKAEEQLLKEKNVKELDEKDAEALEMKILKEFVDLAVKDASAK